MHCSILGLKENFKEIGIESTNNKWWRWKRKRHTYWKVNCKTILLRETNKKSKNPQFFSRKQFEKEQVKAAKFAAKANVKGTRDIFGKFL